MSKVLVHYKDNYADEFDIFGFRLMDEDEWSRTKKEITLSDIEEFSFGTNEQIEYDSVERFLERFWSKPINAVEAKIIRKTFSGVSSGFGHWPFKWLSFEVSEVKDTDEVKSKE